MTIVNFRAQQYLTRQSLHTPYASFWQAGRVGMAETAGTLATEKTSEKDILRGEYVKYYQVSKKTNITTNQ